MVANENPFDPTLPDNTSNEVSSTVEIITPATRAKRFLTSTLVVFAFASIGCLGIAQVQEKRFLIAYVAVSIALMLIPIADHTSTLRQRLLVSLVMPFALAGLAVFVWIYFLMFRFSWFERVFNSKDTGPVGMILFALAGLASGGIMGWRLINYRRRSKIA